MKIPFLIGRLLFGGFFLYNGINHFRQTDTLAQYAGSKNVPAPRLAVTVSGVAMIVGGTSILLGVKPKLGTAAILGFLAGVSPTIHDFWRTEDSNQRLNDLINFTKNLALAGAALTLMGVEEPWPTSVPVAQPSKLERIVKLVRRELAA